MYNQNTIQSKHSQAQNSHKTINNPKLVNLSFDFTLYFNENRLLGEIELSCKNKKAVVLLDFSQPKNKTAK